MRRHFSPDRACSEDTKCGPGLQTSKCDRESMAALSICGTVSTNFQPRPELAKTLDVNQEPGMVDCRTGELQPGAALPSSILTTF